MSHPAGRAAGLTDAVSSADAAAAFREGRLDEAERIGHAVLAAGAADPDILHLLGLIAYQRRDLTRARAFLEQALALRPDAAFRLNLGAALMAGGDAAGAADAFRTVALQAPGMAEARLNLGMALHRLGRPAEAVEALRAAVALTPPAGTAWAALGVALQGAGRPAEAARALAGAAALLPGDAEPWSNLGVVLRALGHAGRAEAAWRGALVRQPDCGEAWLNLGILLRDAAHPNRGRRALSAAVRLLPGSPLAWFHLGLAHHAGGTGARPDVAVAAFRNAAALAPASADSLLMLGGVLRACGGGPEALRILRRAAAAAPKSAETWSTLATARQEAGMTASAVAAVRCALALRPAFPEALSNLCVMLGAQGRHEEAVIAARRALRLDRAHAEALCNLGAQLTELRRPAEAVPALRRAVVLAPDLADGWGNLGSALLGERRVTAAAAVLARAIVLAPEHVGNRSNQASALLASDRAAVAEAALRVALALDPSHTAALSNLGSARQSQGRPEEAIRAFRRAVAVDPEHADAWWNLSLSLLQTGALAEGWTAYEWRWRRVAFAATEAAPPMPCWSGGPLDGRTILLYGEQGLGDMIQFSRYAPLVAQRGATVRLRVPRPLLRLFERLPGVAAVSATDEPMPEADLCCPLMSLPHRFDTRLETIPGIFPYLSADPAAVAAWRARLGGGVKVGLVWAGNPRYEADRLRSLPAGHLAPLLAIPGVRLFSLQKEPRPGDAAALGLALGGSVVDLAPELGDFADTAAALTALDLLVAVDTAVAHLAGALGLPVWTLLREPSDWRWLTGMDRSPWYPSMRLFRQTVPRDWTGPLAQVADGLRRMAAGDRMCLRPW
ncbi:tetratricopeptide repeat protein [Azospirillum himalayense]|uniref:Tetratricopeptide repeat protein n=1 Tax=Azospirillum himalayense TaxID=654847 RepID=A0ABW0FZQ7_9PROT